ncbi:MAG: hypothetical protein ACYC7J_07585 [Syntrophales bacterium]
MTRHREEIAAILVRKLRAYEEFQAVTGLLRTALESEETATVDRCVECREELMRQIEGLDRRIDHQRRSAPADQRRAIDGLLTDMSGKLGEKLKEIITADHDCSAFAAARCEEMRKELAAVRHQKEGFHGYASQSSRPPKFLNVRT